ncbi:hypothetical protein NOK12_13770 [Nocardioides sp. OK12]|uniref:STAS domain-containing protein n=1 Tax=Nocardioides sp. OK12 TaxID=2758661 RepID=UPI0021C411ED|nr:STAS domain-containing protein [Nocardioides sp. OK12]GHJ58859.1 hypothetical protein NOK12_13770 [Nocardioides sp. OK12]
MQHDLAVVATPVATGHARLVVTGELDLGSVPTLRDALARALPFATQCLDLDLAGVVFLDAAGLGALVWCQRRARAAGGECRVVASSAVVERLLHLTGTHDLLVALPAVAHPA